MMWYDMYMVNVASLCEHFIALVYMIVFVVSDLYLRFCL